MPNPNGVVFDNFDADFDPSLWVDFGGTVETNTHGQQAGPGSSGNSLWFGGQESRFATTRPLDTTGGGSIAFLIALGGSTPDTSTWEWVDDFFEEVVLEYSVDGATFLQLAGPFRNTRWEKVTVPIPPEAQTVATRFRFRQLDPGGFRDGHWAIDDVIISQLHPAPEIVPASFGRVDVLPDGTVEGEFFGVAGHAYIVERSTDLVIWTVLGRVSALNDGRVPFTDSTPPIPKGFYRTRNAQD
jgi:hypothetical protein